MKLNQLKDKDGARQNYKRVGRGIGSGKGKTAGRGHKGQHARNGVAINGFEGGQMPLHRRLPKRGFKAINALKFAEVNLDRIQVAIDAGKLDAKKPIDASALLASGVLRRVRDGVRVLGRGELKAKVTIIAAGATKGAIEAVEKAGGKIETTLPKKADKKTEAKK